MDNEMGKLILDELRDIKGILHEQSAKLDEHSSKLDEHSAELSHHSTTLKEHGQILSALRTGQDELKAEIDGIKISNAKEFGQLKEQLRNTEDSVDILREDTWKNKKDINRLKTTIGIK